MKEQKELILRVNGSYPIKFQWGGLCGDEQIGGLIIDIGELCLYNTPKGKMVFKKGGGVMNRTNAKKLMEFIKEGLRQKEYFKR